jgi:DNA-directed RNA polymerase specialized sigma24 family protein
VRWQRSTPAVRDEAVTTGERLPSGVVAGLVARAKDGDGEAFGQLFDHYVGEVYAFVAVRLVDRQTAEDVTQTIFVRALQSLASCRDDAAFPGWLFAIARNIVTDTYRSNRFRPEAWNMTFELGIRPSRRRSSPSSATMSACCTRRASAVCRRGSGNCSTCYSPR